jgi:hypothetical protein
MLSHIESSEDAVPTVDDQAKQEALEKTLGTNQTRGQGDATSHPLYVNPHQ